MTDRAVTVRSEEGAKSVVTQMATIGRIVQYRLSAADVALIRGQRRAAQDHIADHRHDPRGVHSAGAQMHMGNDVATGQTFPMIVVGVWTESGIGAINGQVFLDGSDVIWARSVHLGEGPGTWSWPARS